MLSQNWQFVFLPSRIGNFWPPPPFPLWRHSLWMAPKCKDTILNSFYKSVIFIPFAVLCFGDQKILLFSMWLYSRKRIENDWFSNSFRLFMLGWPKDPFFQSMVVQQKKMPGDLVHQKIQDAIFRSASAPKSRIDIFLLIHKIYSAESCHIRVWIFLTGQNFNSFV